jgi:hypothetical protein
MAEVKITRTEPLPYHNGECGMEHTGNPICIPCAKEQERLRIKFWAEYNKTH